MGVFKPWHIVILVLVVLLLFGAGKLPSLARNVGKSMRIFKSEVEELRGDEAPAEDDEYDYRRDRARGSRDLSDRVHVEDRRYEDRDRRSDVRDERRDGRAYDSRDRAYDARDAREPVRSTAERLDDEYRRD